MVLLLFPPASATNNVHKYILSPDEIRSTQTFSLDGQNNKNIQIVPQVSLIIYPHLQSSGSLLLPPSYHLKTSC